MNFFDIKPFSYNLYGQTNISCLVVVGIFFSVIHEFTANINVFSFSDRTDARGRVPGRGATSRAPDRREVETAPARLDRANAPATASVQSETARASGREASNPRLRTKRKRKKSSFRN